jgi:hypothetical protein
MQQKLFKKSLEEEEEEEEEEGGYYVHTSTTNPLASASIDQQSCNNSFRKSGEEDAFFLNKEAPTSPGAPPYPGGSMPWLMPHLWADTRL